MRRHISTLNAEFKATVDIQAQTIANGTLPRRAQELVLDWAELHQQAYVKDGAVTWPGEIDLAPDAMYQAIKAQGEWVLR